MQFDLKDFTIQELCPKQEYSLENVFYEEIFYEDVLEDWFQNMERW
jgi:hypothetical protein